MELDSPGQGRCPLHDDQVASFSVNRQDSYWHCFAGCGAGSIIDFCIQYQKQVQGQQCYFKMAVTDLAEILLK